MHTSMQRALTLLAGVPALATCLAAAAPAAHATHQNTAPACGPNAVTLTEFDTLGGFHTRIAYDNVTSTQTNVCVELAGDLDTVLVVKSNAGLSAPSVNRSEGTGRCATPIVDMTSPVNLSLSVGVTTAPSLCLGQDGVTTTVTVTGASVTGVPDVDVWTVRGSTTNQFGACGLDYVNYLNGGDYWTWYECAYYLDHQLV